MRQLRILPIVSTWVILAFVFAGCSLSAKEIVLPEPSDEKCIVLYMPHASSVEESRKANLNQALKDVDFEEILVATDEGALGPALSYCQNALVVYQTQGSDRFTEAFAINHIQPYLQAGGLVVMSASIEVPLEKWIGDDAELVRVSAIQSNRNTAWTDEGDWLREPHNIENAVKNGVAPLSGFKPVTDSWEVLAERLPANEGEDNVPYLLRYRLGEGHFVLTSGGLGLAGGGEMFGNVPVENTARLIDNFLADLHKEQS